MTEGIAGSYSTAYSYYPTNNGQMSYAEEPYYTPLAPQRTETTVPPVRADFSHIEEATVPPPSLAQGAIGGAFAFSSVACDCYGITLLGDLDAYDYGDAEVETPVDADGDSMPDLSDEVPMDIGTESDEVDGETAECEWGKIGDDIRVTDNPQGTNGPNMVWTGSEDGIVWNDFRVESGGSISFARLDNVGNRLGDIVVVDPTVLGGRPSLVWAGSEFGIAWENYSGYDEGINFTRLDNAGREIGDEALIIGRPGSNSNSATLVWTGSEYGISWVDGRDSGTVLNTEIYFARLDSSGEKIGDDIRITNDPDYSQNPSLVWTGSEYGVSWVDTRDYWNLEIYFARLNNSGNKIGEDVRVTNAPNGSVDPSLVWNGIDYAIAWSDRRYDVYGDTGNHEIFFTRLDNAGNEIGDDIRVTNDPNMSFDPSLVWTGSEYGISWSDYSLSTERHKINFARLDNNGNLIGGVLGVTGEYTFVAPGIPTFLSPAPSLVWTGSEYGISWRGGDQHVYFSRIGCVPNGDAD